MSGLDFAGLGQSLLNNIRTLLPEWLPGGIVKSNEYICGDLTGRQGRSLSVNLNTGKWADFSSEQKGGDLISLYAAISNISQKDAYYALRDSEPERPAPKQIEPKRKPMPQKPILPPHGHALPFDADKFENFYTYRNSDGLPLFYITRTHDKKIRPWSYTCDGWKQIGWPAPRPIYNLDLIHKHPNKPILIVEGEKALQAAEAIAGQKYIVTTWPNGAQATSKADWTPIYNRKILIWPDADEPGRKAALNISKILLPNCTEVKILDTSDFNGGKDAADFGFANMNEFITWAKPRVSLQKQTLPEVIPLPEFVPMPETAPMPTTKTIHIHQDDVPEPTASASDLQLWNSLNLTLNGSGRPHNNTNNMARAIHNHKKFKNSIWFDEFYRCIFTDWKAQHPREWTDQDDIALMVFIQGKLGLTNATKNNIQDAIELASRMNTRHEPRDWMNSLTWDGTARIERLFSQYFGSDDNEYTRAVSKNLMLSMVARIMRPGCKVDTMVILEGKQGSFKSSALEALAGKFYTAGNTDINKNDFFISLHGFMLVELAELDSLSKADATRIKTVLSTASDNYRAPYERRAQSHNRQSIFVGTTNDSNYLKDSTGARRFWPVLCKDIKLDLISEDREQLFAEAVSLFKSGETWWEVPKSALEEQDARREIDPWEEIILEYITDKDFVTTTEILNDRDCIDMDIERISPMVSRRVSKILRLLECAPGKKRTGASMKMTSGWYTPESDSFYRVSGSQDRSSNTKNYAPRQ